VKEMRVPVILLVDDHLDTREMYAEYLRTCGYEVIPCGNSQECLDLALQHKPDLILTELRMDRMNGIEVVSRLKAERSLASVPVVALTASVLPSERKAALVAGFTRVIPKPCMPDDLVGEIAVILSERS
jgi:CheY-like chemotaxis protein